MPSPPPTLHTSALTFYPSYCYPLSPTYNTWARLTAADVHALRERAGYEGIYPVLPLDQTPPAPFSVHHLATKGTNGIQDKISTSISTIR